jgi:hypothetical protein
LVTVAVDVFELTQGEVVAAVTLPVNWMVDPTHTALGPVIVGTALTVIVVVIEQPLLFVYVIVVDPAANAVTNPVLEIVAVDVLLETQGVVVAAVPLPVN